MAKSAAAALHTEPKEPNFLQKFGHDFVHGDIFTKLSFFVWGLGYIGHGQLIVGRYHHHGRRDQCRDHDKGDHAHQQDLKRIIVIVYNVFHRGNIEHHFHFYGAEDP